MRIRNLIILSILLILAFGCSQKKAESLEGHWRATWETTAGEVPVDMTLKSDEAGSLQVLFHNADEIVKFDRVEKEGQDIKMYLDRYECVIAATISEDGKSMEGNWSKNTGGPNSTAFKAVKGDIPRFPENTYPPLEGEPVYLDISGEWKFRFQDDEFDGIAYFEQEGDHLTATIRTAIGDLRYLEGIYRNGRLCFSCFNGSWVFIFKAELDEDGVFNGQWARGMRPPVPWKAAKGEPDFPDPWSLSKITSQDGSFRFSYPLAENPDKIITESDPLLKGKPFILALTMTGCPNSHDSADVLSKLYHDYHEKGLNIVCVMTEIRNDISLIQKRCQRFAEEHDLPAIYVYSLAMSKKEMTEELPDLERLYAWPTAVFIGGDEKVVAIHTGMDGPGTGIFYNQLMERYRKTVEEMLVKEN